MSDFEVKLLALVERIAIALEKSAALRAGPGAGPELTDADLDSDPIKNDPIIKKDPKSSKGSFVGQKMSAATPEYLDDLAGFHEWSRDNSAAEYRTLTAEQRVSPDPARVKEISLRLASLTKWGKYAAADAKRARAWARRLRAGWKPPASSWGGGAAAGTGEAWKPSSTGGAWQAPAAAPQQADEDRGYPASFDDPIPETPPAEKKTEKHDDLEGWDT